MESLHKLQDSLLINAYRSAVKLNLSKEFIELLSTEIQKRKLDVTSFESMDEKTVKRIG